MTSKPLSNGSAKPSRRQFLATSTTAGLAFAAAVAGNTNPASAKNASVPTPLFNAKPNGKEGCPAEVREALSGPWPTIKTSFTKDGAIDKAALNRQVDFLLDAKAKAIVLTWGDSLFSVLTDDEIAEVTKIVVERVNRRAYVVAATHQWWTGKAAEFTQYAANLGADMIMGLPPDWASSTTVEQLVDYYAALGKHLPVMIVTNYLGRRGKGFSLSLCNRLMKEVPRVMALKDDLCNAVAHEIFLATRDRWSLSAGGQKRNHLQLLPFGVDGYLSTFMGFNPTIAHNYWNAIQSNDLDAACSVITDYDIPFFDYIGACEGGFSAAIYGIYELIGVSTRYRRKPYHSMTDAQISELKVFLKERKILS